MIPTLVNAAELGAQCPWWMDNESKYATIINATSYQGTYNDKYGILRLSLCLQLDVISAYRLGKPSSILHPTRAGLKISLLLLFSYAYY
jgi:hypothetical protein